MFAPHPALSLRTFFKLVLGFVENADISGALAHVASVKIFQKSVVAVHHAHDLRAHDSTLADLTSSGVCLEAMFAVHFALGSDFFAF
jgi:hypothetical protein